MPLVECRVCKLFFINGPKGEEACPSCLEKLDKIYPVVRNFLRDNEKSSFSAYDVSKILDIEVSNIEALITLGLIQTRATSKGLTDIPANTGKIRPLSHDESTESLNIKESKSGSAMHKYSKKSSGKDARRKGDKRY